MKKTMLLILCIFNLSVYGSNEDTLHIALLQHSIDSLKSQVKTFAIIIILMSVFLILLAYSTYRIIRKWNRSIEYLFENQEYMQLNYAKIEEECIKTTQLVAHILESKITNNPSQQIDHGLALKVADELVRIEANLSYIDSSIKGYKQLAKAIERIKENFLANGYEIVDMLGKPYHEGMKVVANFVMDDTLAENEQKITGIIKPQINYNGKMIQSAQIIVSQNL